MEFEGEKREEEVMKELRAYFKPEFLNRLDDIIIFNPLTEDGLREIVSIMFKDIENKLANKEIKAELTKAAKSLIAEAGFDPVYGARPLKRALYELVEDKLAELILEEKLHEGESIVIDAKNGDIVIDKQ
jgi:ATP-dependent Clp protease ATP-binding subunit ClpB